MALLKQTKGRGEIRVRDNIDDLAVELAEYIADLSESSVKQRGVFAIAVSGGSLINLMRKLSEAPYNKTVDWGKWYICWVDECLVGRNHAESNYKLAKENLFSKVPVIPSHMHCISDSSSAEDVVSAYEFVLRQLVKARTVAVSEVDDCPKFDLILLGMGADGHVASLFPNHAALEENNEWVTLITDSPKPPAERITFTLPVINSASNVAVVVTGGDKADALRLAIDDVGAESPVVPARMVHPTSGKLVWFLDSGACSKLEDFQVEEFDQGFA